MSPQSAYLKGLNGKLGIAVGGGRVGACRRGEMQDVIDIPRDEYKIGDKVLLERPGIYPKLISPRTGPFAVTKVYSNGTICIQ